MKEENWERCKKITEWYYENIATYKKQISSDCDLTEDGKEKMKEILNEFTSRIEEYFDALEKADEENPCQKEILMEEFQNISNQFNKIAATTPKLLELKQKIEEKYNF